MYGIQEKNNLKDITLESNHSHFILVDDENSEDIDQSVIMFRSKLESELINDPVKAKESEKINKIPIVKICIHGGFDTLLFCREALKNKVPILVLNV